MEEAKSKSRWHLIVVPIVVAIVLATAWHLVPDTPPVPKPVSTDQWIQPARIQFYLVAGMPDRLPDSDVPLKVGRSGIGRTYSLILDADHAKAERQLKELFGKTVALKGTQAVSVRPSENFAIGAPISNLPPRPIDPAPPQHRLNPSRLFQLSENRVIVAPNWVVELNNDCLSVPTDLPIVDQKGRILTWNSQSKHVRLPQVGGTYIVLSLGANTHLVGTVAR